MNNSPPLYNSRIIKTFIEYLRKFYPNLDIDSVLGDAEITRYEVEDPAHWFTQDQTDRFHESLVEKTGNPNIAREAGRYTTSYKGMGPIKQYTLGLMSLTSVYLLMGKVYPIMSRGAAIRVKKIGANKVEIVSTPNPGVNEKPYQCENRLGVFESLAMLFTDRLAHVEHPHCFHKGDKSCNYVISWEKTTSLVWKRVRNYSLLMSIIICTALFFFLPRTAWAILVFFCSLATMALALYSENIEKKELIKTVETQGNVAQDLLDEMNIRHNNAVLIQEIGKATSSIINVDQLINTVVNIMRAHIGFNRGMIMLANSDKTRLIYTAGYGYNNEIEDLLKKTEFHLDKPESKGTFVEAFRDQKNILINDITEIKKKLSKRSLAFAKKMGAQSLICVPIVFEKESLGILAVDNIMSKRPLTKSDMNFMMGIASQTAVSIANAMSFQKLQESEKKYRDLVENASSIIMRQNIKGNITFFNIFAQKFFNYSENEILGKNVLGTIFPNTTYTKNQLDRRLAFLKDNPEQAFINESENVLREGTKTWIAWTYKPIFDSDGNFKEILCIGNDITELKHAELEKRDLEARLQRAQKMEALGTLAGGVAHDLNNILSGIVSYPELLLMDIPLDSPQRKPILTIQKAGERAAAIVQDLLTLARRGVVNTNVVNLNSIITEYLKSPEYENLKSYHPNVHVKTELEINLMNILGSPVHLSKTVMNLVSNALEAIHDHGEIMISTKNRYVDTLLNGYDNVKEGDYITLSVRDTGIGIPPQDVERIFEPFYTRKVMGKSGTGLGMAVVWGTVKDHNGYIDVKSSEGQGTEFTLFFPVARQELAIDKPVSSIKDIMGNGESILVVDDVKDQRLIASDMLMKLGYSVISVANGEEAVDYIKNNSADLVVLDMIMNPGMDGLDTYKKILEINPYQKAIIASGYSETERVREAQKLGATSYVKKPYLLEKIGQVIKTELDK